MKIIYIDVDSLRPDHTGPYGYARKITPNLDRLAEKSVIFERAYCCDSPCLPSRAALTSQQFGLVNGVVGHDGLDASFRFEHMKKEPDRPLLGGHLDAHGIYPASISCFAERHRAYFFQGNFRESIRPTHSLGNDEDAEDVNQTAFKWLDANRDRQDWFLHLNYWEPHTDYTLPKEWSDRAAALGPAPDWPDQAAIDSHQEIYGSHSATHLHWGYNSFPDTMPDAIKTRADYEKLINGYDGGILYWDTKLGQLLEKLEALGIADDTAIIVSADHGESFGENGSYAEHGLANESTHHIPLVVHWPGLTDTLPEEKRRCDALLYNIDLGPTLCELLKLTEPKRWHGRSYAPALSGESIESRDHLILSHGAHTYQRSVLSRDYLYTKTLHTGCFRTEPEALYHISEDPHQTRNLINELPEVADWHKARLFDWWHHYAGQPGSLPDPMHVSLAAGQGPTLYHKPDRYAAHLEETGRPHLAAHLRSQFR